MSPTIPTSRQTKHLENVLEKLYTLGDGQGKRPFNQQTALDVTVELHWKTSLRTYNATQTGKRKRVRAHTINYPRPISSTLRQAHTVNTCKVNNKLPVSQADSLGHNPFICWLCTYY